MLNFAVSIIFLFVQLTTFVISSLRRAHPFFTRLKSKREAEPTLPTSFEVLFVFLLSQSVVPGRDLRQWTREATPLYYLAGRYQYVLTYWGTYRPNNTSGQLLLSIFFELGPDLAAKETTDLSSSTFSATSWNRHPREPHNCSLSYSYLINLFIYLLFSPVRRPFLPFTEAPQRCIFGGSGTLCNSTLFMLAQNVNVFAKKKKSTNLTVFLVNTKVDCRSCMLTRNI